ncbi:SDR family oxidoreductase [Streptomyces sp. Je 1-4]|uniref:SDR family NAD(P)-dependent oxidoreductase n=1 Tax=Streptomyces TaxID=1883 RepID=UPI0021D7D8CD|nr:MULTISPECIES: SDR family NAD(P)-dependent oxidoreductase [unclassified Streptomyces]UYB39354.1 SDR family oxidoreductase [Streptomyces sp. Je 1-4]UZQ35381.1 SDR family oxidoreductase [Streptomyces sp. Je 1-4] [Streptomyces sp. Je 1-4 4N24]UZQ42799.1 SDR family oxidoreductase [Streptomyces sp. Je 1-4] [Streptomyces sp. Je 1-4 4N24_ara]
MDLRLAGHGALVTGSSAGIGATIAETLADEGCDVLVHGRNAGAAAAVAEQVAARGVRAEVVLGDLTEPGVAEQVALTARDFGAHILVNNAGPFAEHDWESSRPSDWRTAFEGNVLPTVRVSQTLLPSLRAHGWGRVITIGSRAVRTPLPHMATFSAAKAAVVNMTTSLARHLAGTGVTANCVSPGVIVTPSMYRMFEERAAEEDGPQDGPDEADLVKEYAPNPSGRLGRPADIAAAVAYLASPLADYVNGIELRVDGGITGTP